MTAFASVVVLRYVRSEPQTADAIYRRVANVPPDKRSLNRRERHERRAVARQLELLAKHGEVRREILVDGHVTWVGWSLALRDWRYV